MAEVLQLSDGSNHTVFDIRDMMELIDAHLGYEARRWLEEYLTEDDSHTYKIMIEKEYVIGYNNLYEFYNFLQHHSEVRICSKITLS